MTSLLLLKILPLYLLVVLGFILGLKNRIETLSLSKILTYLLAPLVVLYCLTTVSLTKEIGLMVLVIFILSLGSSLIALLLTKKTLKKAAYILALQAGNGNVLFFGIPIAYAVLSPEKVLVYATIASLGPFFYVNTIGFYIASRATISLRESVLRLLRFPLIYAFGLGVILNSLSITPTPEMRTFLHDYILNTFIVMGMILVGLSISTSVKNKMKIDWKYTSSALGFRFIFWPLLSLSFILLDFNVLHIFNKDFHTILFLISIMPFGANDTALATLLNNSPEKTAIATTLSTLIAAFLAPLMVYGFFKYY